MSVDDLTSDTFVICWGCWASFILPRDFFFCSFHSLFAFSFNRDFGRNPPLLRLCVDCILYCYRCEEIETRKPVYVFRHKTNY